MHCFLWGKKVVRTGLGLSNLGHDLGAIRDRNKNKNCEGNNWTHPKNLNEPNRKRSQKFVGEWESNSIKIFYIRKIKTQKKKKKLCVYRIVSHTVYCHHQPFNLSHSHTKQ